MFLHHCSSCDHSELIFADQIVGLTNLDDGFRIDFTCWCEASQSHFVERALVAA